MQTNIQRLWPLWASFAIYFVAIFLFSLLTLKLNDGHFIYVIDDTYIHMSLAKNFSLYGVWGISKGAFDSVTSSLLWPLLLSLEYKLFGVDIFAPFILNIGCSLVILSVVYIILKNRYTSNTSVFLFLTGFLFLVPLPSLTFVAMEHLLQVLFTILFVYYASIVLERGEFRNQELFLLAFLAATLVSVRYEGFSVVLVVCLLFLFKKKLKWSLGIGIASFIPVMIYGLFSISEGAKFFPNSVLLKSSAPFLHKFKVYPLAITLSLLSFSILLYCLRSARSKAWEKYQIMLVVLFGIVVLHFSFGAFGWFFRYEAYLIALGLFIGCLAFDDLCRGKWLVKLISLAIVAVFAIRAVISFVWIPFASHNIYEQQYQMSQFVHQFYSNAKEAIAINDIGAVTFYNDIEIVDLGGLGTLEITEAIMKGQFTTELIEKLTRDKNVQIAIVNDRLFYGLSALPSEWVRVGEWSVTAHNTILANKTLSFYAVVPSAKEILIQNLKSYAKTLPASIKQEGEYTRTNARSSESTTK